MYYKRTVLMKTTYNKSAYKQFNLLFPKIVEVCKNIFISSTLRDFLQNSQINSALRNGKNYRNSKSKRGRR